MAAAVTITQVQTATLVEPSAAEKLAQEAEATMRAAIDCLPGAAKQIGQAWAKVFSAKNPAQAALQIDYCITKLVAPALAENPAALEKFKAEALRIKRLLAPAANAVLGLHAFQISVERHNQLMHQAATGSQLLQRTVDALYAQVNAANGVLHESHQKAAASQQALLDHVSVQKATLEKSIDAATASGTAVASAQVAAAEMLEQAGGK